MSIDKTLYRQWALLRLIPRHPRKISTSELTLRLEELGYEVTKRTVERDLRMFEELFGLVADDRSRPYGWQWASDSPGLDIPSMDDGQAVMLSIAEPLIAQLLPPPIRDALCSAFSSARRRLKESFGSQQLKAWPDKILSTPAAQPLVAAKLLPGTQEAVAMALLRDQWLRITYRKLGVTSSSVFEIQPLGLVMRGPMLYLVCRFRGMDDDRTIALNRIESVEVWPERFHRPSEVSLESFVGKGKLGFGGSNLDKVKMRIARKAGETLLETPLSNDQEVLEESAKFLVIAATVAITPELRRWILGLGGDVEILEPLSLRKAVIREIGRMKSQYPTM